MQKTGRKPKHFDKKLFVVRKYIWGNSALHVLRTEKQHPADECWVDDDWKKNQHPAHDAVGFSVETQSDEDSDDSLDT